MTPPPEGYLGDDHVCWCGAVVKTVHTVGFDIRKQGIEIVCCKPLHGENMVRGVPPIIKVK